MLWVEHHGRGRLGSIHHLVSIGQRSEWVEKEMILSGTVHKHMLCSFSRWFQSRRAPNTIKEAIRGIGSRLLEV